MADGRLAAVDLAATTETLIYTCPTAKIAFVALNICARSGAPTIRVALADNGVPAVEDWIEYDFQLVAGQIPLLREGLILKATDRIYVWASATGVSVVAWGKEDDV